MDPTASPLFSEFDDALQTGYPPPPPPFDSAPEPPSVSPPDPPVAIQEPRSDEDEEPEAEATDAYAQVLKHRTSFPGLAVGGVPSTISRMAEEIAKVEGISIEFASVCCLGALSAAGGRSLRIRGLNGWASRANLYLLIGARSTSGKTTSINHAFKPIRDLEAALIEDWLKTKRPVIEAELIVAKAELKRKTRVVEKEGGGHTIKRELAKLNAEIADIERKLMPPSLVCEDFTSEALAIALKRSGEVLTIVSSDGRRLLQNLLGRNNSNGFTDENILLKGYSGDADKQDRVSRDPLSLSGPCLSATIAIQEDKFDEFFTNNAIKESGLAARFLSVRVMPTKRTYSITAPGIDPQVAQNYGKSIRSIAGKFLTPASGAPEETLVSMTQEALQALCDYTQECEDLAYEGLKGVEMYVRRWAENAHRVALCLHLSQHEAKAADSLVSEETMKHAIALLRWFSAHQLQTVRAEFEQRRIKHRDKLAAILQTKSEAYLAIRDLRRLHGYKEEELNELVKEFPEHFRCERIEPGAGGGRPSRVVKYIFGDFLAC
jgi:hypothetical protein